MRILRKRFSENFQNLLSTQFTLVTLQISENYFCYINSLLHGISYDNVMTMIKVTHTKIALLAIAQNLIAQIIFSESLETFSFCL